ncbi:MAG: InlB B-repeat-containing protein [Oscillospiraceae bacterium]|nr:InlB B-repeat-containing protein [Oscillospiraceae bacterium]
MQRGRHCPEQKVYTRLLSLLLAAVMLFGIGFSGAAAAENEEEPGAEEALVDEAPTTELDLPQEVYITQELFATEEPPEEAGIVEDEVDPSPEEALAGEDAFPTSDEAAENASPAEYAETSEKTDPTEKAELPENTATEERTVIGEAEPVMPAPARHLEQEAGGVTVSVDVPEGALPKNAVMTVTPIFDTAILQMIGDEVDAGAGQVTAVNISFLDENGEPVEPEKPLWVTMKAEVIHQWDNPVVVHLDDAGQTAVVEQAENTALDEMSFASQSFSIYAIVDRGDQARLALRFHQANSGETTTVYVKKTDDVERVVYDPGAGALTEGQLFRGWSTDAGYTAETTAMDIEAVRALTTQTLAADIADGDTIELYPMIFRSYAVEYKDEKGVVIRSDSVLVRENEPAGYTVDEPYTPADQDAQFQGWTITEGAGHITPNASPIANGTAVTLSGDVTLRAYVPKGFWITFQENGSGTSYTAPQFVKSGTVTQKPTDPTRFGYTFSGWYTDPACTEPFAFGERLDGRITLYAGWTALSTAGYTVIIWKQNVAGDGYDFEESISLTGTVGAAVDTVTRQGSGNAAYARVNNVNKQYSGFHLREFTQNVTIVPEGTAVVNVYYDRTEYTLTFQVRANNRWTTIREIKALYEQNIADQFPIVGTNGVTYDDGQRWAPQSSTPYSEVLVYVDVMPAADVTFHVDTANRPLKTMNYYVEALPGETGEVTYNGRSFNLYHSISARYNYVTESEDYIDLVGFTKLAADPAFGANGRALTGSGNETINFYYTRDTYVINYMDGVYVNGNGVAQDEPNRGQLSTSRPILYGAALSAYAEGGADYYEPTCSGYVFSGWYLDETCTQVYPFGTMPEGGVTVYAKWTKLQYRVFLHPNVPADDGSLIWGDASQATSFRVDYDGRISSGNPIMGERQEYELIGWYTDEGCTRTFNFETVLNDATVTETYDKSRSTETDAYGNVTENINKDEQRFWIRRSLDLYAKWRSVLYGANGIELVYEAGNGTGAPTDNTLYLDQAQATAGAASTPNEEGQRFLYWVVQRWNGSDYEDTDTLVFPGDAFTVQKADARVEDITDPENEEIFKRYTVRLRAAYGQAESAALVRMIFDANGGSFAGGAARIEGTVEINREITVPGDPTRPGFVFLGWAGTSNAAETVLESGKTYAADDLSGLAWDDAEQANILYAVWQAEDRTVTVIKRVIGNLGDQSQAFTISVTGDRAFAYDGEMSDSITLTLKSGESARLTVPYGTRLTVTEDDYTGANGGYDPPEFTFQEVSVSPIDFEITEDGELAVINSREVLVDSGVELSAAPFIFAELIALGGVFLLLIRGRRREMKEK